MALNDLYSKKALGENIAKKTKSGVTPKQAAAIAYSVQERAVGKHMRDPDKKAK
jgi:hypothetical protein